MGKIKKWVGDFETSTGNSDGSTNVYLWGIKDTIKKNKYVGVNLHSFFNTIDKHSIRFIYFHNLGWDGSFILHYLLENGYQPISEDIPTHKLLEKQFTYLITDRRVYFKITVKLESGHTVVFGDTAKLLPMKVEDMGKILDYPKGEIDYHKYKHFNNIDEVPKELLDYLWRDIDIVIDFYNGFVESFPSHRMTIGSTSLEDFKKFYGRLDYTRDFGGKYITKKKTYNNEVLTKEQWLFFKQLYKGGLTVGNEKYKNNPIDNINGHSADLNSHYPAVMKNYKLPYGKPLDMKPSGDYIEFYHVYIKSTYKKDKDMISHLHNPKGTLNSKIKYIDEGSNFFAIYSKDEWDELKMTYELVEGINYDKIKSIYFRTKYTWREWITKQEHLKLNAKNKIERMSAKLSLNSPYGKQGENFRKGKIVIELDKSMEKAGVRFGKNNEWVMTNDIVELDNLSYIVAAGTITSIARVILLKAIRKNKNTFLYADTDSIYCSDEIKGIEYDDKEFGKWKPEYKFSKFSWLKPKCYMADITSEYIGDGKWKGKNDIKRAIAGLSVESHNLVNWDNFKSGTVIKNSKRQKKNVKGGLILVDLDYTL